MKCLCFLCQYSSETSKVYAAMSTDRQWIVPDCDMMDSGVQHDQGYVPVHSTQTSEMSLNEMSDTHRMWSSSESMSMAQDFLSSGSLICETQSWAALSSRPGTRPRILDQDMWTLGEARPRVFSMPSRPATLAKTLSLAHAPRIRSFTITTKGLVSQPGTRESKDQASLKDNSPCNDQDSRIHRSNDKMGSSSSCTSLRVGIVGAVGVGKTTLITAFLSETSCVTNGSLDDDTEKSVSILLDGEESTMEFVDLSDQQVDDEQTVVSAYVVVYSVEDRRSYEAAINRLLEIREDVDNHIALILVANKTDLVRTRIVTEEEGRTAAKTYDSKYIEVSAAIDLKIDELLVGVLKQIRLFKQKYDKMQSRMTHTFLDSCCLLQARENVLSKLFKGTKPQSKSCDNLYVL